MMEKFKQFVGAKRGVSPVIGVVLMVAVVVILAAVIGAFVLGLGGDQQSTPQASFTYDQATGTLTMSGGDTLEGDNLNVVVAGTAAGTQFPAGDVAAGTSITGVTATAGQQITVNWQPPDGGDSATLWKTTV